ncbi:MAG: SIR2 family protein [Anaerolineae bacterium]|nr:SIR2 family protein [Anaerolineae bacterium]
MAEHEQEEGTGVKQPYKFLDYYGFDDRPIFFGRERETEILLSDIIATRLVVLFARTGTGKTSLINAGVRPRLEELDYATFYIRVEQDPAESVRKAMREMDLLPDELEGQPLTPQLEHAVEQLQKPLVVFFDQFEEFFIYMPGENSAKARHFIAEIAKLYRERQSGVHIVFSMREEYFVEMDAFRDEIPSIFRNDSNLRLRWFDDAQARAAIVYPAQYYHVKVEDSLVKHLIADLKEAGWIEPARLQIVCHTLWRERTGAQIRLEDYQRLGGANQILNRRLEKDIEQNLDPPALQLFERLLPELSTAHNTKYVRGFDELVKTLGTEADRLRQLVDRLKELGLLRESTRYKATYIEWTSDYLAARTGFLQQRVRAVATRWLLRAAMDRAAAKSVELAEQKNMAHPAWTETAAAEERASLYMTPADFEDISKGADLLGELNREEAEFLFVAALEHGASMGLWFQKAASSGVEVWHILKDRLESGEAQSKQVVNSIQLLGELRDEQAVELLEAALRQPALRSITLEVLGAMRTKESLNLLQGALRQEALAAQAIDVLRRMRTREAIQLLGMALREEGVFALRAGMALNSIASGPPDEASVQAAAVLGEVLAKQAESLFLLALEYGLDMRFWFEQASARGVPVWKILREKIVNRDTPIELARNAVRFLVDLEDGQAGELLELASRRDALAQSAQKAASARQALENIRVGKQRPSPPAGDRGLTQQDWAILLNRIKQGKCTPLLGSGVNLDIFPPESEIALRWAQEYRYPLPDVGDLPRVAKFLAVTQDSMFPKEALLRQLSNVTPPPLTPPDEPHGVLANLPLPVYITTTYDDLMVQALSSQGRRPERELCRWNKYISDQPSIFESRQGFQPTVENPLVFHLYGHNQVPESLVLTEDDYLDFVINIARDGELLPSWVQRALTGSSLLAIGYSPEEWSFRVLLRSLITAGEPGLRRLSVLQLLPPEQTDTHEPERERKYLQNYFDDLGLRIYWGTTREFTWELWERWAGGG